MQARLSNTNWVFSNERLIVKKQKAAIFYYLYVHMIKSKAKTFYWDTEVYVGTS